MLKLLVPVLLLALNFDVIVGGECDEPCVDKQKRCTEKWTKADCNTQKVLDACPLLCDNCPVCEEKEEKVNGGFSSWEVIIQCPKKCVKGDLEVSTRECNNPKPKNGGKSCNGAYNKIKECYGCDDKVTQSDIDDLTEEIESVESSAGSSSSGGGSSSASASGTYNADSSDNNKKNGYRLAFRHTAGEMSGKELINFYQFGNVRGYFRNSAGGSQYRDPNLHFFWCEADDIKIDIFNVKGENDAYVLYSLGDTYESRTTLTGLFDSYKHLASKDQHFTDIGRDISDDPSFNQDDQRLFKMVKNHGGCDKDALWFTVHTEDTRACDWDEVYIRPEGNAAVTHILYSAFKTVAHAESMLQLASKFEIRISGSFKDDAQNGFKKVFRYPSQAGVHILDYLKDGNTDPAKDRSAFTATEVKTHDMYRHKNFKEQLEDASVILVVIEAMDGTVGEALLFRASGDHSGWFNQHHLVSTQVWDCKVGQEEPKMFSLRGDDEHGRTVFINEKYAGCGGDRGWLVIPCMRDDKSQPCDWDNLAERQDYAEHHICGILYSPSSESVKWHSHDALRGRAIEFYVKK